MLLRVYVEFHLAWPNRLIWCHWNSAWDKNRNTTEPKIKRSRFVPVPADHLFQGADILPFSFVAVTDKWHLLSSLRYSEDWTLIQSNSHVTGNRNRNLSHAVDLWYQICSLDSIWFSLLPFRMNSYVSLSDFRIVLLFLTYWSCSCQLCPGAWPWPIHANFLSMAYGAVPIVPFQQEAGVRTLVILLISDVSCACSIQFLSCFIGIACLIWLPVHVSSLSSSLFFFPFWPVG